MAKSLRPAPFHDNNGVTFKNPFYMNIRKMGISGSYYIHANEK